MTGPDTITPRSLRLTAKLPRNFASLGLGSFSVHHMPFTVLVLLGAELMSLFAARLKERTLQPLKRLDIMFMRLRRRSFWSACTPLVRATYFRQATRSSLWATTAR